MSVAGPLPTDGVVARAGEKKDNTWIWVLAIFLVLCVCLVLGAGAVGVYLYTTRADEPVSQPPAQDIPMPPVVPTEARPAPPEPTAMPLEPLPETLVIEFYRPPLNGLEYLSLYDYVSAYEWRTEPGTMTWEVSLTSRETVVVNAGWCAIDVPTLDENYENIQYSFFADGLQLDLEYDLFNYYDALPERSCQIHSGIVRAWPLGGHVIIITMSILAPINDGWDDYPAGDYTDIFTINVTP
jgi:hypothetical protein